MLEVGLVQCVLVYIYICNALMHDLVWLMCYCVNNLLEHLVSC